MNAGVNERVVWDRVCTTLRSRIGERNFASWIAPLRSTWTDGSLALEAPDRQTRDQVARHFLGAIEEALAEAVGRTRPVRLGLATARPVLPLPFGPLRSTHTFDNFMVADSNRRACAAARAIADDEARGPVFVHGPSGVGKTHLLHATHHALDAAGVAVACLSAAQLVSSLVAAYATRADDRFWADLGSLRGLLLDDAHSVHGLEEIQERLMDGLEAWVDAGRLLVLTSDRAPEEMPAFAARLRARFARGVVVSIGRPETALRVAILHRRALALGVALDDRLAARLARAVGGNVRRLEGALTRLLAHAHLSGRPVDERLAVEVLPELRAREEAPLTVERILEATATTFRTSARRLRGRSRSRELVLPRQVAMYLARALLGAPFGELAAAFGRDHTTVLHAWRTVSTRRERDADLSAIVDRITSKLGRGEER